MRLGAGLAALAVAGLAGAFLAVDALRAADNPWLAPATAVAGAHGWRLERIDGGPFRLTSFHHMDDEPGGTLAVYIEGDGFPWATPTELSDDPTPRNPRVLELAVQDPATDVAYLARPCQYLPADELGACPPATWSLARYAEPVVAALDLAIDRLKAEARADRLRLVGVSGGGTLAALIAARRDDVERLVTVAANLDHDAWSARHGTTPLAHSLNAADVAAAIEQIPQVHFVGADDDIVTSADVEAYVARMDDRSAVEVVVVPGYGHVCCWAEDWPALLAAYGI